MSNNVVINSSDICLQDLIKICCYANITCDSLSSALTMYYNLPSSNMDINYAIACLTIACKYFEDEDNVEIIQSIHYVENLYSYEIYIWTYYNYKVSTILWSSFIDFSIQHPIKYYITATMIIKKLTNPAATIISSLLLLKHHKYVCFNNMAVNNYYSELALALLLGE